MMKFLSPILALCLPLQALAAPLISEFMASNSEAFRDGDRQFSDWVEIHNPDNASVNLKGWHLTDSATNLTKWEFPEIEIPAKGYSLVICSGSPVPGYIDGDGWPHASFQLSSIGEYLALVDPEGQVVSEFSPGYPEQFNDVAYGSFRSGGGSEDLLAQATLRWLVPTDESLEATWNLPIEPDGAGFIDGTDTGVGFESNPGSFDPFIDTHVIDAMRSVNASIYIRHAFVIPATRAHSSLTLSMQYDDGFVAYLNGVEIASRNAPEEVAWNSIATASHPDAEAEVFEEIDVSDFVGLLRPGEENVLAIQGMNRSAGGSDFLIVPQLTAQFEGDGPLQTGYLASATPGTANANQSAEPGPGISDVTRIEQRPSTGETITITAKLTERIAPIKDVMLYHRIQYEDEVAIEMMNDGAGTYSATLPVEATAGQMLRWRIVATDTSTNETRAPLFLDQSGTKQSAEYYGTVVQNSDLTTQLPLFEWFAARESSAHSANGTRVSVFYEGRFYDNAYARQRGGATNGTISQKFVFNNNEPLYVSEELPALKEINVNGQGSDTSYLRQTLAFNTYTRAGHAACASFLMLMRANADTDRVGVFIEQVDEDFLSRHGYDSSGGELYKFGQRSNLNPVFADVTTGVDRKNGDATDRSSAQALVDGLALDTSEERVTFLFDHLDLPQILNYLALRSITQDADDVRKNFYMFHDTYTDGLWRIFPWDKDWTFGVTGDGGTHLRHPFFGDSAHAKQNANQWNRLYDVMFGEEVTQRMYLRRLKTLADTLLQHPDTPEEERLFEKWVEELSASAADDLPRAANSGKNAVLQFFPARRGDLFGRYAIDGSIPLLPESQPTMPNMEITAVEFDAAAEGSPGQFVSIANREETEIDISGWKLSDAVRFTFPSGTVIPRQSEIFVARSIAGFRSRVTSPKGSERNLVVGPFNGQLSASDTQLVIEDASGAVVGSTVIGAGPSPLAGSLAVAEIHYHPADPNDDAEFIELVNVSDTAVSLEGLHFSEGVDFDFAESAIASLQPGERLVIIAERAAFEAVYGTGLPVAGVFANGSRLANGGEDITIVDADARIVLTLTFGDSDPWPAAADGGGPSLVLIDSNPSNASDPASWKASAVPGGTPGTVEQSSQFTGDPNADQDGDGIHALLEFALGTSDLVANGIDLGIEISAGRVLLHYGRSSTASGLSITYEISTNLQAWNPAQAFSEKAEAAGDNRVAVTVDLGPATETPPYFRIRVIN
ncbi:MAG: lamin tail domain-containing protein [Verrucomicrobiae bacterium]|nr:lamin tail domain-containing protein [Verrucomicrobiae bacterium]